MKGEKRERSEATIDRAVIAEEAARLESAGADWEARHVGAVLGMARSTIYNTPWLMRIGRRVGKRGRRWNPREVRNAQAIASGHVGTNAMKRTGT